MAGATNSRSRALTLANCAIEPIEKPANRAPRFFFGRSSNAETRDSTSALNAEKITEIAMVTQTVGTGDR